MLKGGSKEERTNERTNERTGVNPDDGDGARGNKEADRSTDAMRTAKAVSSTSRNHHPSSSVSLFQPVVRFIHPISFRRVPFHSFRRFPRSMIIDPSLRASCILVIAHRRPRRRASSSPSVVRSAVVASHAPERECSSCGFVRVAMSRPNPGARRGNSVRPKWATLEWAWERESVPFFWVITRRF